MTRYEIRVSYRRRDWASATKRATRTYGSEKRASNFVARLEAEAPAGISPAEDIRIERREVGAWAPFNINGDK